MSYDQAISLMNKGPSKPTLYSVRIGGRKISDEANNYLNFFCKLANIPGISATTAVASGQEYQGIIREQPTGITFSKPFEMQIIENSDLLTYKELRRWFNQLAQNTTQGGFGSSGRSIRMNYYNSYVSNIEIRKLELPDDRINIDEIRRNINSYYKVPLIINLINAYPVTIQDLALSSSEANSLLNFTVQFTYESHTIIEPIGNILV